MRSRSNGSRDLIRSQTGPVPLKLRDTKDRAHSVSGGSFQHQEANATKLITVKAHLARSLSTPYSLSLDSDFGPRAEAYRVLEFLHCGNVEMGSNIQYLCKNKIRYLLNLTGIERIRIRSSMTCSCPDKTFHAPKELVVDIDENTDPKVLMFSRDGKNACQAMAIQYIMQYHKRSLDHAIHYFKLAQQIALSDNMVEALRQWDVQLQNATDEDEIRSAESRRADWVQGNRALSVDSSTIKRVAWQ